MFCALDKEQIRDFRARIFGKLYEQADKKQPVDVDTFIKEVREDLLEASKDEEGKVDEEWTNTLVGLVPEIILRGVGHRDLMNIMPDNTRPLKDLVESFSDPVMGYDNVVKYLAPEVPNIEELNADFRADQLEPKEDEEDKPSAEEITEMRNKLFFFDTAYPISPWATTGQQSTIDKFGKYTNTPNPEEDFYYNVNNKLVDAIRNSGELTGETLTYSGHTGFKLTIVRTKNLPGVAKGDYSQLRPRTQRDLTTGELSADGKTVITTPEEFKKKKLEPGVVAVITNNEGELLYFNDKGEITTIDEGGKIVYQTIRTVQSTPKGLEAKNIASVSEIVNKAIDERAVAIGAIKKKGESANDFAARIGFDKPAYEKDLNELRQKELQQILDIRNYLTVNPQGSVILDITGGSKGYYGTKITPLSKFNIDPINDKFRSQTENTPLLKENRTYLKMRSIDTPIELLQNQITDQDLINNIAQVLSRDLIVSGIPLSNKRKFTYVTQFFAPSKTNGIRLYYNDDQSLSLSIKGKKIDLLNPDKVALEKEILEGLKSSRIFYSITNELISINQLVKLKVDGNNAEETKESYIDYIIKNNQAYAEPATDGRVYALNGYLTFDVPQDQLDKIHGKATKASTSTQLSTSVKPDIILPIGTSGSGKSTWIKSLPKDQFTIISPDEMRVEFTGDINDKSKDDDIYKTVTERTIKAVKKGKQVIIDTTNLKKERRRPFIEAVKKAIPNANIQYKLIPLNAELAKQRIKADIAAGVNRANVSDETIDRHAASYKEMLDDIKSEDMSNYDTQLETAIATEAIKDTETNHPAKDNPVDYDDLGELTRSRILKSGASTDEITAAMKWWKSHPLSKFVPLNQMVNITNSDAWATWTTAGITLYNGSNYTDIYHEAWHAFSQLYLSIPEKKKLYQSVKDAKIKIKLPDGTSVDSNLASNRQIEEYLAEEFRNFSMGDKPSKTLPKATRNIFQKIWDFIKSLFAGLTPKDIAVQQAYIQPVQDLFDNLYFANKTGKESNEFLNHYTPNISNVMFGSLRSGAVALEEADTSGLSFDEEKLIISSIDSLISTYVDSQNLKRQDRLASAKIFSNFNNQVALYSWVQVQLQKKLDELNSEYNSLTEEQKLEYDNQILANDIKSLKWAVDNIRNIEVIKDTLRGTQKKGMIARHREKSVFKDVLADVVETEAEKEAAESTESATSDADVISKGLHMNDRRGNELSIKQLASLRTLYLIQSLHQVDSTGKVTRNRLGFPNLVNFGEAWNSMVRNLAGSSTPEELYSRLADNSLLFKKEELKEQMALEVDQAQKAGKSPAEVSKIREKFKTLIDKKDVELLAKSSFGSFVQLADKLGPPTGSSTKGLSDSEFDMWTAFWQDFNKPRIPLVQMTNSRNKDYETQEVTFSYSIGRVSSELIKVQRDWSSDFKKQNPADNKYVQQDNNKNNFLNLERIVSDFGTLNKSGDSVGLIPGKEFEFLKAIGIYLDNKPEIRSIINSDKSLEISRLFTAINYLYRSGKIVHEPLKILTDGFKYSYDVIGNKLPTASKDIDHASLLKEYNLIQIGQSNLSQKNKDLVISTIKSNYQIITKSDTEPSQYTRLNAIANIQSTYSDSYSNLSVTTATNEKAYEHSLNNSMTVILDAVNKAKTFQDLYDPNGATPWMNYMDPRRNPGILSSQWLNSVFILNINDPLFGTRRKESTLVDADFATIDLENLSGIQMTNEGLFFDKGVNSSNASRIDKFLSDFHMMLDSGHHELMKHASKSSAYGAHIKHKITYSGKKQHHLYVDTDAFLAPTTAPKSIASVREVSDIVLGYLKAEVLRAGLVRNNPEIYKDYTSYSNGTSLTIFDDIIQDKEKSIVLGQQFLDDLSKVNNDIIALLNTPEYAKLGVELRTQIGKYFDSLALETKTELEKAEYISPQLYARQASNPSLLENPDYKLRLRNAMIKSYTVNTWIHNVESTFVFYGDLVQFNHSKDDFNKRNAGIASTGYMFRTDKAAQDFINSQWKDPRPYFRKLVEEGKLSGKMLNRQYDGTFNTAIIQEAKIKSAYYDFYADLNEKFYKDLYKKEGYKGKELTDKVNTEVYGPKGVDKDGKPNGIRTNPSGGIMKAYFEMDEGDGQGYVTFDSYRMMKKLESKWSDAQENLFMEIVAGKNPSPKEMSEFFPPYKVQYWGPLKTENLPVTAFHKFSLFPLIPTAIKDTQLEKLHNKMVEQGIDYSTFQSGSKLGTITTDGKSDEVYTGPVENRQFNDNVVFTPNVIYLNYLKDQLDINNEFKGSVIFSTQLRKLAIQGLYKNGIPADFMTDKPFKSREDAWSKLKTEKQKEESSKFYKESKNYETLVDKITELKRLEFLKQAGWEEDKDGNLSGNSEDLVRFVQAELKEAGLSEHDIEFLNTDQTTGEPIYDWSGSLIGERLERMLIALVNNKIIKQKMNGEPLIQVAGSFFEKPSFTKPTAGDLAKYGTNQLPTYHPEDIDFDDIYKGFSKEQLKEKLQEKEQTSLKHAAYWSDSHRNRISTEIQYLKDILAGNKPKITQVHNPTTAMKVKVALQGDFNNLLKLKDKEGKSISQYITTEVEGKEERTLDFEKSLARLNELLKDDEWLDMDNNRKKITMVGVRIPVQGLNSMEFMEVYEFLPPSAGNILIAPSEIVAKSGADFDIDKLTMFTPKITSQGGFLETSYSSPEEIQTEIDKLKVEEEKLLTKIGADLSLTNIKKDLKGGLKERSAAIKSLAAQISLFDEKNQQLISNVRTALLTVIKSKNLDSDTVEIIKNGTDEQLQTLVRGLNKSKQLWRISKEAAALNTESWENYKSRKEIVDEIKLTAEERKVYQEGQDQVLSFKKKISSLNEQKRNFIATYENKMITSIRSILELPENFITLTRPNGTDLVKGVADELMNYVQEKNHKKSKLDGSVRKKGISPTRVLEPMFVLDKHQDNNIGKTSLSIAAITNPANTTYTRIGGSLPPTMSFLVKNAEGKLEMEEMPVTLYLNHNKVGDRISMSHIYDTTGTTKIADIISQLMNGFVDVEKDAWVAYIQGNPEVLPILLSLVEAGTPFREAAYFVSNPLVREYVREQRKAKGIFAGPLKTEPINEETNEVDTSLIKSIAVQNIWAKYNLSKSTGLKRVPTKLNLYKTIDSLMTEIGGLPIKTLEKIVATNSYTVNKDAGLPENSKETVAAFLHFLQIEKFTSGTKNLRLKTNVDTKKDATLFDAKLREVNIENLHNEEGLETSLINRYLDESIISSFRIQNFQQKLWGRFFKTKNNDVVNEFLVQKALDKDLIKQISKKTGWKIDKIASEFKNNFMLFMFQNYIKSFELGSSDIYKGMKSTDKVPVQYVDKLNAGVLVKEDKGIPYIYIDQVQLEKDWNTQVYCTKIWCRFIW
jgi:predicted kinase